MLKQKFRKVFAMGTVAMLSLYLAGCGAQTAAVTQQQLLNVKVTKVALTELPSTDTYLGTVTPYVQTVVSSPQSGILSSVIVRVGDKVVKGQSLATLNEDLLQAQKRQTQANVTVSASQKDETEQNSTTSQNQAKAALEVAETNLANAQKGETTSVDANQTSLATQITQTQNSVTAAEKALATAQSQLKNAKVTNQNDITQKQSALDSAKANLDAAQQQRAATLEADQEKVAKAKDALDTAETQLNLAKQSSSSATSAAILQARSSYDQASITYQGAISTQKVDQASGSVSTAQAAYDAAESALEASRNSQTVVTAQAQVDQAQQTLDAAKTNLASVMSQSQASDKATQTTAANNVASAKAALKQAQVNYDSLLIDPSLKVNSAQLEASQEATQVIVAQINQGQIDSPISGYVVAVDAQVGEAVGPSGGFVTIASMDPLTANVDIPESNIGNISVGMAMEVSVPAVSEILQGTVSAIHPQPDATTKAYSIEITLQNSKATLLPNMRVEAHELKKGQQGLVIPADSILTTQSGALSVFVIKDGLAHSVTVKVGSMTGSVYEITSGLNVGDQLVVQGQNLLSEGDKVTIAG